MTKPPRKEQILERATELFFKDNPVTSINPEPQELQESGYIWQARNELMRDNTKFLDSLESNSLYDFEFDVDLMQRSNLLISGANHSGKSTLASKICSIVKTFNWQVIVFDNVGNWKEISDLVSYIDVDLDVILSIPLNQNLVLNMSNLTSNQQGIFVDKILEKIWNTRTLREARSLLIVLEESEISCKNLRGKTAQNILRIMHSGRNKRIRVLAITTDLALIDPSFIRLCLQRYHGRLGIEENSKRKFKSYYGSEWLDATQKLELGQFVYLNDKTLKVIYSEDFKPKAKPEPILQPIEQLPQQQSDVNPILRYAFIAFLFLGLLVLINAVFR